MNVWKPSAKLTTILYTILHFCVDGLCSFVIFASLYKEGSNLNTYIFLAYNMLAFVTQPLVGLLQERIKCEKITLGIAAGLLVLGVIFKFVPVISPIFLGIGNSFFHISGGKHVIEKTNNNIIYLGIFVSTGAIGLILGQIYHTTILLWVFLGLLVVLSIILIMSRMDKLETTNNVEIKKPHLLILVFLVIVVFVRAFIGKGSPINFALTNTMLVFIYIATAIGKALGGVVAKVFGINKTMIVSLVLATIFLVIGDQNPYLYFIGISLFNFTMPITLYLMGEAWPHHQAIGFGLLAAVLFPGYLLGLLYFNLILIKILIIILNLLSIALIIYCNMRLKKVQDA